MEMTLISNVHENSDILLLRYFIDIFIVIFTGYRLYIENHENYVPVESLQHFSLISHSQTKLSLKLCAESWLPAYWKTGHMTSIE